jgi:glutaredoxin 3
MKLYIKPTCPWCVDAVRYLDNAGFKYEKIDVLGDPAAYQEMIKLSGQRLTPTLDANGKVLADFDVDQLEEFLAKHQLRP